MTLKPTELAFGRYFMPNTLGRSEYEDIGARLVEIARKQGQWVGVPYNYLAKQFVDELKELIERKERAEMDKQEGIFARVYNCIKSLFGRKKQQVVETANPEAEKNPFSVLTVTLFYGNTGVGALYSEIRGMADEGYIDLVDQGSDVVLVPTRKFVETVYKAQKEQRVNQKQT